MFPSVLVFAFLIIPSLGEELGELILVQAVFRHGDRGPVRFLPTYANEWESLRIGPGQLTSIGVTQHREFGRFLRISYIENEHLLPSSYNYSTLRVRSTDYDRTLMSADALLSTLYPDTLIPVHTIPYEDDSLLAFYDNCPSFFAEYDLAKEAISKELESIHGETGGLLDRSKQISDSDYSSSVDMIGNIRDNAVCMTAHKIEFDQLIQDNAIELDFWDRKVLYALWHATRSDPRGKVGAELLRRLLTNMESAKQGLISENAFLFSAHDSTLVGLFDAFGMIDGDDSDYLLPKYATSFILELRRLNGEDYVRVKVGEPSPNGTGSWAEEWSYNAQYVEFECPNKVTQCSLQDFSLYVNSQPSFGDGCCRIGEGFTNSECFYNDGIKNDSICQKYYKMCPTSSCGTGFVFSEAVDTCLKQTDSTDPDTMLGVCDEKDSVIRILVALVLAFGAICGLCGLWICLKDRQWKRYVNLSPHSHADLTSHIEIP